MAGIEGYAKKRKFYLVVLLSGFFLLFSCWKVGRGNPAILTNKRRPILTVLKYYKKSHK